MKEAEKKKAEENKKKFRLKPFLVGVALVFAVLTFITQQQRMAQIVQEREELEQQRIQLMNKTQRLERMLQYSQSDSYIEQMAHKRLGWVKPGDILFYSEEDN